MKHKRIYIDTEFTGFGTLDLISLGCVSDCGQAFYAETDMICFDRCNDFVRATVLPLLSHDPTIQSGPEEMCRRLRAYLAQFGMPVEIRFYFKGDWLLFRQILETNGQPLPHNIRKRNMMGGCAQRQAMQNLFDMNGWPAHHALNDARVLMMACEQLGVPATGIATFVRALAQRHGVIYTQTPADALAEVLTRLADDEVEMDDVEQLLLALERAGILPSETVVPLHVRYLREKFNQTGERSS